MALQVFVFDELFGADQDMRAQARQVREAADGLVVKVGGLPPEAQSIVAGLGGLRGRLERAADQLAAAGSAIGQVRADVMRADAPGWLPQIRDAFRGNVFPPGGYGPLGPFPWLAGRVAWATGAGATFLKHRYGYPWADDGRHWRVFGSGPRLHPQLRGPVDVAAKVGKVGGAGATFASALSRRLKEGSSVPKAAAGAAGETGSVLGCAAAGARAGAAVPIPHPVAKGAVVVGGGIVGGAACSAPGKWVGDRVSDGVGAVGKGAGAAGKFVAKTLPKPWKIKLP